MNLGEGDGFVARKGRCPEGSGIRMGTVKIQAGFRCQQLGTATSMHTQNAHLPVDADFICLFVCF